MNKLQGVSQNKSRLSVTQPYIPPIEKYMKYVEVAFNNKWLTNGGPLLDELTLRLKEYLNVNYLLLVNNGTSALQIAYKLKGLTNIVTTPFTFPATSTALNWQGSEAQLADIDSKSWNLCPKSVKSVLQQQELQAIVPVNIFGAPCDMEAFDKLGAEYNIPVIYDSAQAFLSKYKDKSVLYYGDIHCISFHATKLFHCVEGGALTFNNKDDYERAKCLINFGIAEDGCVYEAGINAKMSEIHAAMGLCVLDALPNLIEDRAASVDSYQHKLNSYVDFQATSYDSYIPPMYMPIKLKTSTTLKKVQENLKQKGYESRNYFSPQLNKILPLDNLSQLPVCNQVSDSILCLPLMHHLDEKHIKNISDIVKRAC